MDLIYHPLFLPWMRVMFAVPTVFGFAAATVMYLRRKGEQDIILKALGLSPEKNPITYFIISLIIWSTVSIGMLSGDLGKIFNS